MNKVAVVQELVRVAKLLTGKIRDIKEGINQAKANVKRSGVAWYVNSTSDGIRVEKSPIKGNWAGNRTLAKVDADGSVEEM